MNASACLMTNWGRREVYPSLCVGVALSSPAAWRDESGATAQRTNRERLDKRRSISLSIRSTRAAASLFIFFKRMLAGAAGSVSRIFRVSVRHCSRDTITASIRAMRFTAECGFKGTGLSMRYNPPCNNEQNQNRTTSGVPVVFTSLPSHRSEHTNGHTDGHTNSGRGRSTGVSSCRRRSQMKLLQTAGGVAIRHQVTHSGIVMRNGEWSGW